MSTATIFKKTEGEMKALIARVIQEVLSDPDFGLELTEQAKKRLRRTTQSNRKGISLSKIKQRYS